MIDPEFKQLIINLCREDSIPFTIEFVKGIVAPATIYKWLAEELTYSYTQAEQLREWERIQKLPGNYNAVPSTNKIILSHQLHYYAKEKELYEDKGIRQKLLENRKKYIGKDSSQINSKEILRGFKISGIYTGFSHFSPFWIKAFIEEFSIKSIYDPCGGWGHRMLGAHNINYIYNDFWKESFEGVNKIKEFLDLKNVITYNNNCIQFTPAENYECVFTCPPYFNTEQYNNKQFKDLKDYLEWWRVMIVNSIKAETKYFAFVINQAYQEDLVNICLAQKLNFVKRISLGNMSTQSHFNRKNNSPRQEFLNVFTVAQT